MTGIGNTLVATNRGLYEIGRVEPLAFAGKHVAAMERSANEVYAVVGRHEIWRTQAFPGDLREAKWEKIASVDRQAVSLYRTPQALYVGTEEAHLLRVTDDGTASRLQSFKEAPGRDGWFTPWGGPPATRTIDATDDGELFVNVHVGGILRSTDDGESWQQTIDIRTDVHQVLFHDATGTIFAPSARGFAESADRGGSWTVTTDGLDFSYMRAVAVAGDTILASASNGPHGDRGAVYSRPLGSREPFVRCTAGLPEWFAGNVDTFCLVAGGSDAGEVALIAAPGGTVYLSEDAGRHWREIASGLPQINAVAITG